MLPLSCAPRVRQRALLLWLAPGAVAGEVFIAKLYEHYSSQYTLDVADYMLR